MADVFSLLVFFIYTVVILITMLYISANISILVMIFIPLVSVYFLPEMTIQFLTTNQFSFIDGLVVIQNIHILLMIWPVIIGMVAYMEIVSWYLSLDQRPKRNKQELPVTSSNAESIAPQAPGKKNITEVPFLEKINNKFNVLAEICEKLPYDKKPILVGGSALEFYTKEPSKSIYVEILADRMSLIPVLQNMNFVSRGRWFYTKDAGIEVVGESVPGKRIIDVTFEGKLIRVLSVEDLIIDRLKIGKFWKSQIDIKQAQLLAAAYSAKCDRDYIIQKMKEENLEPELIRFN
jgi:hypothetical protein